MNTYLVIIYTKQARNKQDEARYVYEKIISLRKNHLSHIQNNQNKTKQNTTHHNTAKHITAHHIKS